MSYGSPIVVDLVVVKRAIRLATSLDQAFVLVIVEEIATVLHHLVGGGIGGPRTYRDESFGVGIVDRGGLPVNELEDLLHGHFCAGPSCSGVVEDSFGIVAWFIVALNFDGAFGFVDNLVRGESRLVFQSFDKRGQRLVDEALQFVKYPLEFETTHLCI